MAKNLQEELRIIIIGKTGTGKSATGNSILGKKKFESKISGQSVTSTCSCETIERFDRKIVLVDTPGIFDTKMTEQEVEKEIAKCVILTCPGLHAILFTVNIGRFTQEEEDAFKIFANNFGEDMYKYLVVVFTMADNLKNENQDIDSYVESVPMALKTILLRCNNRFVPFDNTLKGSEQELQVQGLIKRIDDVIRSNGGCCYTNEMYKEAEKIICERKQELLRQLQEDQKRTNEEMRQDLRKKYERDLANMQKELDHIISTIEEYQRKEACALPADKEAYTKIIQRLKQQKMEIKKKIEKEHDEYRRKIDEHENQCRENFEEKKKIILETLIQCLAVDPTVLDLLKFAALSIAVIHKIYKMWFGK